KRPTRMSSFVTERGGVADHIWLGTSVELAMYRSRIEILKRIPARVKFVSFEPLLGPIGEVNLDGISWAIVGGESGPNHRPIRVEWIREIQRACKLGGTAFFFKQWGGNTAKSGGRALD